MTDKCRKLAATSLQNELGGPLVPDIFQRARGGRRKKEKGKKERKREKRERDSLLRFLLAHASA